MKHPYIAIPVVLVSILFLLTCSLPKNRPPWPVTGPVSVQELTDGTSFQLQISDSDGIIDNPGNFDPDGDEVTFTAILSFFENPGVVPDIKISRDGIFSVDVWDAQIEGYFGYYHITISDGDLSRTTDFTIPVYFY